MAPDVRAGLPEYGAGPEPAGDRGGASGGGLVTGMNSADVLGGIWKSGT